MSSVRFGPPEAAAARSSSCSTSAIARPRVHRAGARLSTAAGLLALILLGGFAPAAQAVDPARTASTASAGSLTQQYITRVYTDLFSRVPDPVGLQTWSSALLTGTPRVAVANAITGSAEYRGALITESYRRYLKRAPDGAGLDNWLGAMSGGLTIQQMECGLIVSPEYYNRAGGTDRAWVAQLYLDVLGRTAATSEVDSWAAELRRGARRAQVAFGFLLSSEHLGNVLDSHYQHLLGRGIDASGRTSWVGAIQGGARTEAVIGGIVASAEYYSRVAPTPTPTPTSTPTPTPTSTAWAGGYGLFEDTQYLTGTALSTRLDEYTAVGVQWARFQLLWSTIQSGGPTSYDWKPVDDLVDGLLARGIRPIAVIGTTPSWASRPAGCAAVTCAPADPAQFAAFAARAAARYGPRGVHAWEVWNEPNSASFWKPTPDVASYTVVLKQTYAAIKAADPLATVITGGVAPAVTTSWSIAPLEFLAGIYSNGGHGSFDGVGWHPYTYPRMPGTVDNGDAWYQMYGPANSARAQMTANGDAAKQIWATEFGAHTDPLGEGYVTEAGQAEMFRTGLTLWTSYAWAGPMIVYMLRDRGTDAADRENFFGLTRYDGSPKPGYATFTSLVGDFAATYPTF